MGLLNRIFGLTESIANEIELDDESIKKIWDDYLETVKKEDINDLEKFKELLVLEIVDIKDEKREEEELISDLESLEHSERIHRVHEIERTLDNAVSANKFFHELLRELYKIKKFQMHIVEKILSGSENKESLISHLKSQKVLEQEIIDRINNRDTFHHFFISLARGEHKIHDLTKRERRMIHFLDQDVKLEGMIDSWVTLVFEKIEDKIHEYASQDKLEQNPHADIQFVNSDLFRDLAEGVIKDLKKKGRISEEMINSFVHMFREKYESMMK